MFTYHVTLSWFGLAVRQKGFGSIPLRHSFLFKKVVACGHCLVTVSLIVNETFKWLTWLHTKKTKIVSGVHVVENYVNQSKWDEMTRQTRQIVYLLHILTLMAIALPKT